MNLASCLTGAPPHTQPVSSTLCCSKWTPLLDALYNCRRAMKACFFISCGVLSLRAPPAYPCTTPALPLSGSSKHLSREMLGEALFLFPLSICLHCNSQVLAAIVDSSTLSAELSPPDCTLHPITWFTLMSTAVLRVINVLERRQRNSRRFWSPHRPLKG